MARKRKKLRAFGMASKDRYVKLDHWLLDSLAWHSLSPVARSLLIAIWRRHNGLNNGEISFSIREAVDAVAVCKDTATKAFRELQKKGFLKARKKGSFDWKKRHATEWEITAAPHKGERATKDFMRWQPDPGKQNPAPLSRIDSPNRKDRGPVQTPQMASDGTIQKDCRAQFGPADGTAEQDTYIMPGRVPSEGPQTAVGELIAFPEIPAFLDRRKRAS